jgi:hypothetical protein
MLQHASVLHHFLRLNNIPLHGDITICLSTCLSVEDIWVVSTFSPCEYAAGSMSVQVFFFF